MHMWLEEPCYIPSNDDDDDDDNDDDDDDHHHHHHHDDDDHHHHHHDHHHHHHIMDYISKRPICGCVPSAVWLEGLKPAVNMPTTQCATYLST